MAFAITQTCCSDASCLSVCPVNCIHPTPGEPDFGLTEQLYVDPRSCIDCGACADACPVDAVFSVPALPVALEPYAAVNASYYDDRPVAEVWDAPVFPPTGLDRVGKLRVAVVGTGPAACYAAQVLVRSTPAEITMYDRSPVAGGLARFGVAPDHLATRRINTHFKQVFRNPRVTVRLGVEVGTDVPVEQLQRDHDAIVWAVGAGADRVLGLPGEEHVLSARTFVHWYNGEPSTAPGSVDLTGVERVVVVGNGNVALDAARILLGDPVALAETDIAPHALAALGGVREVVVLGRRSAREASFTSAEVRALRHALDVVVEDRPGLDLTGTALEGAAVEAIDWSAPVPGRRLVFAFDRQPISFSRDGVDLGDVVVPAGLVLKAIGYRGAPLPGLPHDPDTGRVPSTDGRVDGLPGSYVVGWARRGATGGIGANKADAEQVIAALVEDAAAGRLTRRPARRLLRRS